MSPTREEKIKGSLLGLAWGDVLGCPVEGWRASEIQAIYGNYEELPREYPFQKIASMRHEKLKRLRPLGLHSDDTQQALGLIDVCLSNSFWSRELWADWLVQGMQTGAWRGYGRNFSSAVHKLAKGKKPQHSGSTSAGIGAAMRVAPLGALYRDNPEVLAEAVMESSLITHGDIRAGALAYAVAYTTAALISGQAPEEIKAQLPDAVASVETLWLEGHADWVLDRSAGHLVSQGIAKIFAKKLDDPELIRQKISKVAKPHLAKGFTKAHPNQGFVLLGGLHALTMALSLEKAPGFILTEIIRQGYDTDTVAAICGGLLGSRFGTSWIPLEQFIDRKRLADYAEALVVRDVPPEDQETFVDREADLTKQEVNYQARILATKYT
jgi:ADP-ribosylglycohydrolase